MRQRGMVQRRFFERLEGRDTARKRKPTKRMRMRRKHSANKDKRTRARISKGSRIISFFLCALARMSPRGRARMRDETLTIARRVTACHRVEANEHARAFTHTHAQRNHASTGESFFHPPFALELPRHTPLSSIASNTPRQQFLKLVPSLTRVLACPTVLP